MIINGALPRKLKKPVMLLLVWLQFRTSLCQPSHSIIHTHPQHSESFLRPAATSKLEAMASARGLLASFLRTSKNDQISKNVTNASSSEQYGYEFKSIADVHRHRSTDLDDMITEKTVQRLLEDAQSTAAELPQNITETFEDVNLDYSTTPVYHCNSKVLLTSLGESMQNYIRFKRKN